MDDQLDKPAWSTSARESATRGWRSHWLEGRWVRDENNMAGNIPVCLEGEP